MIVIHETYENGALVGSQQVDLPDELGHRATIEQQAREALAANRTFLALGAPTNAQTLAEVKALTRQVNALIRLQLADLTGTD